MLIASFQFDFLLRSWESAPMINNNLITFTILEKNQKESFHKLALNKR